MKIDITATWEPCAQCGKQFFLSDQMSWAQYKEECAKRLGGIKVVLCGTCYQNPDRSKVNANTQAAHAKKSQEEARQNAWWSGGLNRGSRK